MSFEFYKAKVDKVLLFFIVASHNFFALSGFDIKTFQYIHLLIFGTLIWATLSNNKYKPKDSCAKWITCLVLLPLLSVYSCNVINGQSIGLSLVVYRMHLGWLVFFYLYKRHLPLPTILKTIFVAGMGYALITLVQQITYPIAPFGQRTVGSAYSENFGGAAERRMGFYRFMVGGLYYAVLAFFFVMVSAKIPHKKVLLAILGVGIIACGTRTAMFSVFVAVVFYYLFSKNVKYKYPILVLLLVATTVFYFMADAIFGRLANVGDDLEDGRMPSYYFYWNEITQSPLAFLFGNGLPNAASAYGRRVDRLGNSHVTPSDIGMVGTMYYWGAIYVVAYLVFALKWMFNKRLSILYKSLILIFLIRCPIAPILWEIDGFMLQGILFYLCNVDIHGKSYTLNNAKNRLKNHFFPALSHDSGNRIDSFRA